MSTVNIFDAKSNLSRLIQAVEDGTEHEITIARNGRPVARLVRLDAETNTKRRIGVAAGRFVVPDDIDTHNDQVLALFAGSGGA